MLAAIVPVKALAIAKSRLANILSQAERRLLLERAEAILVDEDLPLLPLFHFVQVYLYDAHRVIGISSHPRQDQAFDRLRIER